MNWIRGDEYHLRTDDGRYTIAATFDATHVVYMAYRIDSVQVGRHYEKRPDRLGLRRAAIEDRAGRNAAVREMQAICETDSTLTKGAA